MDAMSARTVGWTRRMKSCILCGGDHEPSVNACMANEDGIDRRIKQIGARAWNRLSGRVQRVRNAVKCCECGKFLSHTEMIEGAKCDYTPSSDRSSEEIEWMCKSCIERTEKARHIALTLNPPARTCKNT